MQRKWFGFSIISLASFCLFTVLFHTVANAQVLDTPKFFAQGALEEVKQPTPTIYFAPQQAQPTQSLTQPSPTPTIYIAPSTSKQTEPTPTSTPLPTVTPTSEPTTTPEPTVAPTDLPTTAPVTDLESLFTKYSSDYGVDKELLKKIARCESGFNATSNNSGMYLGMYQFSAGTWSSNRSTMGLDTNPDLRLNAEESIRTAAYMISRGGQNAWPNCH